MFYTFDLNKSKILSSDIELTYYGGYCVSNLSQTTNLRLFQTDDDFRFDENGGKLYTMLENSVGKGEIARYEQFLLFPQCFQKTFTVNK